VNLYGELSRYRKRNRRSLDGAVAGIDWNRYHGGHRSAEAPVAIPTAMPLQYHEAMPHAYDPHPGFMELREPEYELHAEASVTPAPTPPIRFEPDEPQAEQSVPDHVFIEMYDSAAAEHRAAAQEAQSGLPAVDIGPPEHAFDAHDANSGMHAMPDESLLSDEQTDSLHGLPLGPGDSSNSPLSFDPMTEAQAIFDEQMAMFGMPQDAPQQSGALDQPMYDPQMMQMLNPWMVPGMGPMM
jgi:hypothetical protein